MSVTHGDTAVRYKAYQDTTVHDRSSCRETMRLRCGSNTAAVPRGSVTMILILIHGATSSWREEPKIASPSH
jgi:hypothetical protein